jgi:hypothetical protein
VQESYPPLRLLAHRFDELTPTATVAVWTDARRTTLRAVAPLADATAWLAAFAATAVTLLAVVGPPPAVAVAAALVVIGAVAATWDVARIAADLFAEHLDRSAELSRNGMLFPDSANPTDHLRLLTRRGVDLTNREIHRLATEIAATDAAAADVFGIILHGSHLRVVDAARTAMAASHWGPAAVAA